MSMPPEIAMPAVAVPILSWHAWSGGLAVAGVALALGGALLPRLRGWRRGDAWLVRAAAGLGASALAFLLAGQWTGLAPSVPWGWIGVAGWLACGASLARQWSRDRKTPAVSPAASPAVWPAPLPSAPERLLALAGWAMAIAWLASTLTMAFCPSVGYDVLEYHLAIVARTFATGRVAPIPGVFYSAQPTATEMLYAMAAAVEGTAHGWAPGVAHWLLSVLMLASWARLAPRIGLPRAWAPWAWLLLAGQPVAYMLQIERLTDWTGAALILAGLLAAVIGLEAVEASDSPGRAARPAALALGLIGAGAVGAKWTHLGTVAAPLAALGAMLAWRAARRSGRPAVGWGVAAVGIGAFALAFLAWPLWLWRATGNPCAPFLAGLFPTMRWTPGQLAFLMETHGRVSPLEAGYWINLARRLMIGSQGAPLPALGLAAGLAMAIQGALARRAWRRGPDDAHAAAVRHGLPAGPAALGLAAGVLAWGQLRNAEARFLAPCDALGLTLAAQALGRWSQARPARGRLRVLIGLALALTALAGVAPKAWQLASGPLAVATGRISQADYLNATLGLTADMFRAVNRLPPRSRVLAIDEARGLYFERPVDLATVFDRQPIRPYLRAARDGADLERRLAEAGYTHLLVNEFEQARLLVMHTPPALRHNAAFLDLARRPDSPERQAALAKDWAGYSAFAADPLSFKERSIYLDFLERLRRRAIWSESREDAPRPAIWIAPLERAAPEQGYLPSQATSAK